MVTVAKWAAIWSLGIALILAGRVSVDQACRTVDNFTAQWARFNSLDSLHVVQPEARHGR